MFGVRVFLSGAVSAARLSATAPVVGAPCLAGVRAQRQRHRERLGCPYPSCDQFPCFFCVAVGPRPGPGSAGPPTTASQPVPLSPLRGGRRPDLGTPKVALKDSFKPKRVRRILSLRRIEEYQQLECSHAVLHLVPDGIGSRLRTVYVTYSWS